jgi:Leucine-rich repeat (LRR) protein
MNIIESERENVRRDNNSAQDELMGIIENLSKSTSELVIREPLHGDLDFAYLGESGFNHIKHIELGEGEITSIRNLPDEVRTLIVGRNLLTNLDNLSHKLEKIVCEDNYLTYFDGKSTPKLQVLNLSNNKVAELSELPEDLEELYVTNNQLKILDVENCQKLRILHASNNPMLVIEHVPASLVDIQSENTPFADYTPRGEENSTETDSQKIDYIEALHQYFKLKNQYDTNNQSIRKDIYRKAATKKIGRTLLQQYKPKCVNCKRPVGTIFELKDEYYVAMCGDTNRATKCNLDIKLYRGGYSDEEYMTYLFKEDTEKIQTSIIRQKLDVLFNYIGEAAAANIFKKKLEHYTSDSSMYKELLTNHNQLYYSEERHRQMNDAIENVEKITLVIKHMVEDYEQTNNKQTLRDAVQMQITDLHPAIENLRRLKYSTMEVDNKDIIHGSSLNQSVTYLCTLVQKPIHISDIDQTFGEKANVVKFVTRTKK